MPTNRSVCPCLEAVARPLELRTEAHGVHVPFTAGRFEDVNRVVHYSTLSSVNS